MPGSTHGAEKTAETVAGVSTVSTLSIGAARTIPLAQGAQQLLKKQNSILTSCTRLLVASCCIKQSSLGLLLCLVPVTGLLCSKPTNSFRV